MSPRGRSAVGGLQRDVVGRVDHRVAAVDVVERLDRGGDRDVPVEAGERVVGVLLHVRVGQDLRLGGGLHAGALEVEIRVARRQPVVHVLGVDLQGDLDPVHQLLAVRVVGGVPVRVPGQLERLADLVAVDLVWPGGEHVLGVLGPVVLRRRYRDRLHVRGQEVELGERLLQPEDDRGVVRRLDRGQPELVRRGVLVRPGVVGAEQRLEVGRAVGQHVRRVVAALDGVLHVLGADGRAVVVLEVRPQLVRPGPAVVADLPRPGGEVRHDGQAVLAGRALEHHQGPPVEPGEVPRVGVVGVARVDRVPVVRADDLQGAALGVRRIHHRVGARVERGPGVAARLATAAATTAARGHQHRETGSDRDGQGPAGGPHPRHLFLVGGASSIHRVLGSRASRSPSPRTLKASTVTKIAAPGMTMK